MPTLHHLQTAHHAAEVLEAADRPLTVGEIDRTLGHVWNEAPDRKMLEWCLEAMRHDHLTHEDGAGHVRLTAEGAELATKGLAFFFAGHATRRQ